MDGMRCTIMALVGVVVDRGVLVLFDIGPTWSVNASAHIPYYLARLDFDLTAQNRRNRREFMGQLAICANWIGHVVIPGIHILTLDMPQCILRP